APHNRKKTGGEQAIGFVVGRKNDGLRTYLANIGQAHAARNTARFGLIAHGRGNAAFFARDDRTALQLRAARLLTGRKKRIAINVEDGTGKGPDGKRGAHAYFRITARTTAAIVSSSWG